MKSMLRAVFACSFLSLAASAPRAEPIHVYTEELPPFNFTQNGKITGMSTEVVEAVMKQVKLDVVIESYPWARTVQNVQERAGALIYSIGRQPKRENLFKWIGVIVPTTQSVFALKDRTDIEIKGLEDLKKYRIGTTLGDAREAYLVGKGFDVDKLERLGGENAYAMNFQKLKMKRIDLWPMPEAVAYHIVKMDGGDPQKVLRKVYELTEISGEGYYLAANPQTSEDLVVTIRNGIESFKKTPEYRKILEKWGINQ